MDHIADLGYRIELVSMDPHFHDISISLYEQRGVSGEPQYLVHTYSGQDGAKARIDFVVAAMKALGGLEDCANGGHLLRFTCGRGHERACRRIFLEACKVEPGAALEPRPLSIYDKKSEGTIQVESEGEGVYRLSADGADDGTARRVAAVAGGLVKLAEMAPIGEAGDGVAFACGQAHDAAVGLLLARALNVRAAMRERVQPVARGVLAAPSAQGS